MSPTGEMPQWLPRDEAEARVAASFHRLAGRMPVDADGLAAAAMKEAVVIHRRRTTMVIAGLAAALAIAIPVAWQAGNRAGSPVPAGTTTTGAPATGAPSTSGTEPTAPTSAASRPAEMQVVRIDLSGTPSGRIVRPYVLEGRYHGVSGEAPVGERGGVGAVLRLTGGALAVVVDGDGWEQHLTVQDASGTSLKSHPGYVGAPVANADGSRFASFDPSTDRVAVFDARGAILHSRVLGGVTDLAGFSGTSVIYTKEAGGSFRWDTATGALSTIDAGATAVDASDTRGELLVRAPGAKGKSCWSVRTAPDFRETLTSCRGYEAAMLSADGAYVIGRDLESGPESPIVIGSRETGQSLMRVDPPAGAAFYGMSWRADLRELVVNVVTDDGRDRLVGCSLDAYRCEVLTPTVDIEGWPESNTPYVLVRD